MNQQATPGFSIKRAPKHLGFCSSPAGDGRQQPAGGGLGAHGWSAEHGAAFDRFLVRELLRLGGTSREQSDPAERQEDLQEPCAADASGLQAEGRTRWGGVLQCASYSVCKKPLDMEHEEP